MRLLLDENLPIWLADELRKAGHDAKDLRELGKRGLDDELVYRLAIRERRHLVSANYKDFGNPLLYPPTARTGIVVIRMPRCSVRTVASQLQRLLNQVKDADLSRTVCVLEPARFRRRRV